MNKQRLEERRAFNERLRARLWQVAAERNVRYCPYLTPGVLVCGSRSVYRPYFQ
jgi:hypothetical protein